MLFIAEWAAFSRSAGLGTRWSRSRHKLRRCREGNWFGIRPPFGFTRCRFTPRFVSQSCIFLALGFFVNEVQNILEGAHRISVADDWRPLGNTFAAVAPRFSGILVGAGGFSSGQHVTLGLTKVN